MNIENSLLGSADHIELMNIELDIILNNMIKNYKNL